MCYSERELVCCKGRKTKLQGRLAVTVKEGRTCKGRLSVASVAVEEGMSCKGDEISCCSSSGREYEAVEEILFSSSSCPSPLCQVCINGL